MDGESSNKSTEKRKLFGAFLLITFLFGSVALIATLYFSLRSPAALPVPLPPPGDITVTGKVVCLPHHDTGGPQTPTCAYGIEDIEGRYFALSDIDPEYRILANLPMNEEVTVKGFYTPGQSETYKSIGVIEIVVVMSDTRPLRATLEGTYVCLPHINEDEMTDECTAGILLESGEYYAINFVLMSQMVTLPSEGNRISGSGVITPVVSGTPERYERYPISGLFSVTDGLSVVTAPEKSDTLESSICEGEGCEATSTEVVSEE